MQFLNSLRTGSPIDKFLNLAYISVLPKPAKDTNDVSNYRPIPLINNDLKILTNTDCLTLSLYTFTRTGRASFSRQQGPDQMRRAIDIMPLLKSQQDRGNSQEGFLLSIDLQKAFNMVTWPYLFKVLESLQGTSHLISTPNIFKLLREFGIALGLQVNVSKSMALNISVPNSLIECLQEHFSFSWNSPSIPYLGSTWPPVLTYYIQLTIHLCLKC